MRLVHAAAATGLTLVVAGLVAVLVAASPGPVAVQPKPLACSWPALAPFQAGLGRMAAGDAKGAVGRFELATGLDGHFAAAWVARAHCELQLGARRQAALSARRALDVWAGQPWSPGDATAEQLVRDTYAPADAGLLLWRASVAW